MLKTISATILLMPTLQPAVVSVLRPAPNPPMDNNRFDADASAQMERMVQDLGRMYRERNEALQEVARAHHDALFRLALAAEYRDDDTGVHIVRMGFLAEALALAWASAADWATTAAQGRADARHRQDRHPRRVLKKPGSFTPDERAVMNRTRDRRRDPRAARASRCSSWPPRWR
jgi:putative two-component system response regulator